MQTLCYHHSKDKEQANNEMLYYFYLHCKCIIFLICKYNFTIFNIYLSNCAFNVSCRLIFESYLKYLEWLIIGLVAKYVSLMLYLHCINTL
jgi:hypothetical protein